MCSFSKIILIYKNTKMKKKISIAGLLLVLAFSLQQLMAQAPPPPSGTGGSGDTTPAGGGGAPIGSGIGILLALGAAYGGKKVYQVLQKQESIEE